MRSKSRSKRDKRTVPAILEMLKDPERRVQKQATRLPGNLKDKRAKKRRTGELGRRETLMFNGYEGEVAPRFENGECSLIVRTYAAREREPKKTVDFEAGKLYSM